MDWGGVLGAVRTSVLSCNGTPAKIRDVVFIPRTTWDNAIKLVKGKGQPPSDGTAPPDRDLTPVESARMGIFRRVCFCRVDAEPDGPGRGVLLGNQVNNQRFQDLGSSPASFEASRWADFFACLPGHSVKLADAIQAYIQAKLRGPLCWVELPTDAWPPEIMYWKFRRPGETRQSIVRTS